MRFLLFILPLIDSGLIKRDDLSTSASVRLLCKGKPYLDGRIKLVVGKKVLDEARAFPNGTYAVSSPKYSATYSGVVNYMKLLDKAGVQIFHTCNKKNCWEMSPQEHIPHEYVSTPRDQKKPFDMGRVELNLHVNDDKIDCVKMT